MLHSPKFILALCLLITGFLWQSAIGDDKSETQADSSIITTNAAVTRGYRTLRTKAFLPPDFDQQVFNNLWKLWPEPFRSSAEQANPEDRRRLTFSYYGFMEPPDGLSNSGTALGYVDDGNKGWVMNCLACHGGKVAGQVIPGLPNSHYALQTLTEDVRLTKLSQLKPLSHLDLATLKLPLSTCNGTTNSVIFGVVLGALRNNDMSVDLKRKPPKLMHHDMDAPPWWNLKKKTHIYCDAFAPKNHRILMQFILLPANGKETVEQWEDDFRDILAWIESLEAPKYPWDINQSLATQGKIIFNRHCADCHGTYGKKSSYPEKVIPIDVVDTDPLRLKALGPEHRRWLKESWMSFYGKDPVELEPVGYLAPPLDGIWATAPYLHNGSVPTLWHLFHPDNRPKIWQRTEDGYDQQKVGLEISEFETIPHSEKTPAQKRRYFDTTKPGKSARGHLFPNSLNEDEKLAVLEYLKTI